jgi:hypothetical protein
MHHIKRARLLIESNPTSKSSQVMASLVRSLESDESFEIKSLYELNGDDFDLAMGVMKDWRLDRYYLGKARIFDIATYSAQINS